MNKIDILTLAVKNAMRGRFKTFLCALSICIGIFSVCTISGLGNGAQSIISSKIEQTGLGGIAIYPQSADDSLTITRAQIGQLSATIPNLEAIMPMSMTFGHARFKSKSVYSMFCGINESLPKIFNISLLYGRLPGKYDMNAQSMVAVVDNTTAMSLFSRENIIGNMITATINEKTVDLTVIGVVTSQTQLISAFAGENTPQVVYVPYTAINIINGSSASDALVISCINQNAEKQTAITVEKRLKIINDGIEFKHENIGAYTDSINDITKIVSLFINSVASISVLVGGIGVMNSMTSSIDRRRKEIGIYLALGATKTDILQCFLFEAVIICLLGGSAGGLMGYAVIITIEHMLNIKIDGGLSVVIISILGAALCGIVFGITPAAKAAKLNPIDAMIEK